MKIFEIFSHNPEEAFAPDFDLSEDLQFFIHNDPEFYRKYYFPFIVRLKEAKANKTKFSAKAFEALVKHAYNVYRDKFDKEKVCAIASRWGVQQDVKVDIGGNTQKGQHFGRRKVQVQNSANRIEPDHSSSELCRRDASTLTSSRSCRVAQAFVTSRNIFQQTSHVFCRCGFSEENR